MEFCVFTEPQQGATYRDVLAAARVAEDGGFDGFFRSDHYLSFSGDGQPGPSDAWTTLAGLARDTRTLRLGTLVSPATFREPAVIALQVAQVDDMSGGRVELGLGAGWFAAEHSAFGLAFPELPERFDRFEEQLAIVTGLWSVPAGQTYSFAGAHYRVTDNPGLPRPVQPRIPLIVGGGGPKRTPRLAATFATEFNYGFCPPAEAAPVYERAREACFAVDRDPTTLALSWAGPVVVGRDDAEVARRCAAIGKDAATLAEEGLAGSPAQLIDLLARLGELGVGRAYLQILDLADLDHVELIAAQVLGSVR
jgi:F420-dependent oxidoreductase-like protein